ncbi:hypothetical protein [Ilyobacter polytropus]|nr:hypothetical protein [Ilyobacter polytropus]
MKLGLMKKCQNCIKYLNGICSGVDSLEKAKIIYCPKHEEK